MNHAYGYNSGDLRASRECASPKTYNQFEPSFIERCGVLGASSRHAISTYIRVGFLVSAALSASCGLWQWQRRGFNIIVFIAVNCYRTG